MAITRIYCPNCKRVLGDTDKSIDCNFNCRGCKKTVRCKITITSFKEYLMARGGQNGRD